MGAKRSTTGLLAGLAEGARQGGTGLPGLARLPAPFSLFPRLGAPGEEQLLRAPKPGVPELYSVASRPRTRQGEPSPGGCPPPAPAPSREPGRLPGRTGPRNPCPARSAPPPAARNHLPRASSSAKCPATGWATASPSSAAERKGSPSLPEEAETAPEVEGRSKEARSLELMAGLLLCAGLDNGFRPPSLASLASQIRGLGPKEGDC